MAYAHSNNPHVELRIGVEGLIHTLKTKGWENYELDNMAKNMFQKLYDTVESQRINMVRKNQDRLEQPFLYDVGVFLINMLKNESNKKKINEAQNNPYCLGFHLYSMCAGYKEICISYPKLHPISFP